MTGNFGVDSTKTVVGRLIEQAAGVTALEPGPVGMYFRPARKLEPLTTTNEGTAVSVSIRATLWSLAVGALVQSATPTSAVAQEFIIHANGDSINGDVKGFKRGKLEFEIPGGSSTYIEFDDVSAIGSPDYWDIELDDLTRVLGSIEPGSDPGSVRIVGDDGTREVPLASVVQMTSIENGFWSRFDGFLEFGFSFAKANSVTNYTLGTRVDYRGTKWASGFAFDSRLNSQDGVETTTRNQASLNFVRLLPRTWYAGAFTQLEQNGELDLDLRLLLGAIAGRDIVQSNRVEWRWRAGLLSNREDYTGLEANTSAEALIGTDFSFFTFGDWENDISSTLSVYPSLSESERVRVDFDLKYRQDLFGDFYLSFSFYDQYDSRPPEGATENDYGTTLALGWDW